ncbi:cob(I)yrinic acid a,c-diamide adenosyltransferase [Neptuniibacter caesariensis]|uniref:Corrinoid adenosyltransferase n=1 Tax=Neptuniibacter caesariensis TaxID=207954 RepID=A0A7U8GSB4_NEPCE|nr:cob(I)yrinic acid a,c-diamide adenosyltransferase [Neptuniibacter caesariensis]EAR61087.1 Cobalamin adenosyltransferase [Neptuniibacter caesariensis]
MANRLTRIYTRGGDQGKTSLATGARVPKNHIRIETIGTVDELNSLIGVTLANTDEKSTVSETLLNVQHHLFDLGGELAMDDASYTVIDQSTVKYLEEQLDQWNELLPPLKEFILPGGGPAASYCHLARSVCRRAERIMTSLCQEEDQFVNPESVAYLNRLSDLLFVASRYIVLQQGGEEVLWKPKGKR